MKNPHQFTEKELLLSLATIATNNVALPINSLPQTLTYTDGKLTSASVVYGGLTYVQTYGYTGENLTSISAWATGA